MTDSRADGGARAPKIIDYEEARGFLPALRRRWKMIAGGIGFLFLLFLWWGFQPVHGGMPVGICRTLAELQLKYPDTLRMTAIDGFHNKLRLYFTHVDEFGETRSEIFECQFNDDMTIADAIMNRDSIGADKIAAFNTSIPAVISAKPSTVIPGQPSDNLKSLKP